MGNKNSIFISILSGNLLSLCYLIKLRNMFFLHRIWNWCSRFRHRCGYGVHSPSDFFLITSVVYENITTMLIGY